MKKALFTSLLLVFVFLYGNIEAQNIYTSGSIATAFCAGTEVSVPYTINYTANSTNTFTAQLSDSTGNFTNPLTIGIFTGTTNGTIAATLPATAVGSHYKIRVTGSNPAATGSDNGTDIRITKPSGDPSLFGNGFWNVSCYNGNIISNLSKAVYYGSYTENSISFNSTKRWANTGVPSNANSLSGNAYSGCSPINIVHSVSYKRTGFACGVYQLDVLDHDDDAYLVINGTPVWNHSGCCDKHMNVWTGFLDPNTTVEFKWINNSLTSNAALVITPVSPTAANAVNALCVQFNGSWNAISNATSYSLDIATDMAFTSILPAYNNFNVGNTTSYLATGLSPGRIYYYRVRANFTCGASGNSNSIKVDLSSPPSGSTTWIGTKSNDWFDADNWCGGVPNYTTDAIIMSGGKFMPLITTTGAQAENLQIDLNASLTNNKSLSVYGNWNNNGNYFSSTGVVEMRASSSSINGTGSNNFYGLSAKTPSSPWWYGSGYSKGSILLNASISVSGNLTLANGILYTSATKMLTVNPGGTISLGNENSYVDGPMNYIVAASGNTQVTLPLGNAGDWRPAVISVDHSSSTPVTYTAKLTTASAMALGYKLPSTLSAVSAVHYWQIDRQNVSNLSNAKITLYYDVDDQVNDYQDLVVANAPAAEWKNLGGTATANVTGTITSSTFTAFGKFALANMIGGENALPVSFLEFKAYKEGSAVQLEWSTATEKNNDYFTVEKSFDGISFEAIDTVKGAGNSNTILNYRTADEKLSAGLSYYRIKQTDFDNQSSYSMMVCVNYTPSTGLTVCPNPANSGSAMMVSLPSESDKEVLIVVRDVQGQEYYSKVVLSTENHQLIAITTQPDLAPGMYIVIASSDNNIYSQKIIVK